MLFQEAINSTKSIGYGFAKENISWFPDLFHMKIRNLALVMSPFILIVLFFLHPSFSEQEIENTIQIYDKISCEAIDGIWNNQNDCSIINFVIKPRNIIQIGSNINFLVSGNIDNYGELQLGNNSSLIIFANATITNHEGTLKNIQSGRIINRIGGTIINNEQSTIENNFESWIHNQGFIKNNGNITNNRGYIENIGVGNFNECIFDCGYRKILPLEGLITNDAGGVIINSGGKIINSKGARILNINSSLFFNIDNGIIINKLGGIVNNYSEASFINEKSIIFNDESSVFDSANKVKFHNGQESIIFNSKGSFFNIIQQSQIINNGIIFNDGGTVNLATGIVKNFNKFFNDCGGIIVTYQNITEPIINIPCK